VTVGETREEARRILELASRDSRILPAAGLYPTYLDLDEARRTEELIRDNRKTLRAIGEVGLDYWKVREPADRKRQRELFIRFIDLAGELDLPLNVHSRSAGRATIELLLSRGVRRVQMHAFDGRAASAQAGVDAGYFFSVPPSVVRSPQKQKLVRRLPLSCLLLETDSPVLGPLPDERNEPANVTRSLAAIAELKSVSPEKVATAVAANTQSLYRFE
jgi:TatD DNase family protein